MNPTDFYYSKEHEWVHIDSQGMAVVGITDYAQDQLGDIVFLDLPSVGATLTQFQKMGEIESVKAVSDLFIPISGRVIEVNPLVSDQPELVNHEPYVRGWMIRVEMSNPEELKRLMNSEEYEALIAEAR